MLALVKAYIIDIWEERKSNDVDCAQQPRPHSPTGDLGEIAGVRIVKGCVSEVSLAQVSCILMYVYVAPPTPVGAWSMALGLRQRLEYYYYHYYACASLFERCAVVIAILCETLSIILQRIEIIDGCGSNLGYSRFYY